MCKRPTQFLLSVLLLVLSLSSSAKLTTPQLPDCPGAGSVSLLLAPDTAESATVADVIDNVAYDDVPRGVRVVVVVFSGDPERAYVGFFGQDPNLPMWVVCEGKLPLGLRLFIEGDEHDRDILLKAFAEDCRIPLSSLDAAPVDHGFAVTLVAADRPARTITEHRLREIIGSGKNVIVRFASREIDPKEQHDSLRTSSNHGAKSRIYTERQPFAVVAIRDRFRNPNTMGVYYWGPAVKQEWGPWYLYKSTVHARGYTHLHDTVGHELLGHGYHYVKAKWGSHPSSWNDQIDAIDVANWIRRRVLRGAEPPRAFDKRPSTGELDSGGQNWSPRLWEVWPLYPDGWDRGDFDYE